MKPSATEQLLISGPAGPIEVLVDVPEEPKGLALIAHPHPLFGGNNTNKVTFTVSRTLRDLGYCALRPNFRGVGLSAGMHDHGEGEAEDLLAVLEWAREHFGIAADAPVILAGFSFGAYVQTRVAKHLAQSGHAPKRIILIGTAAGSVEGMRQYDTEAVGPDTLVIHGSKDETVPLENVLQWAEPLDVPVVVVPGADHFFHGRLKAVRDIIQRSSCECH